MKKSKSVAKSELLTPPRKKKKKMKKSGSKLMDPTASSMQKQSFNKNKKKSIKNMNDWIKGLRNSKAPPKRAKSKSKKKKGKGKGVSIKAVARNLKSKFLKNKAKKSASKKKPISKSRSKAKGKRGKSTVKSKTPAKKGKKGAKSKTVKKKKKKPVKKKKKPKAKPEEEEEVHTEQIMLGGNNLEEEENADQQSKKQNFEQELNVKNSEPEITNLMVQVGGGINREDEKETGVIYSLANHTTEMKVQADPEKKGKQFEVQDHPGIHLEYNTGEGKLEFGPEDQIIEHIFTMHWSQVDKILLRAKVAGKVAPPSKRMTILEMGRDVYSKQRNYVGGEDNLVQAEANGKSNETIRRNW